MRSTPLRFATQVLIAAAVGSATAANSHQNHIAHDNPFLMDHNSMVPFPATSKMQIPHHERVLLEDDVLEELSSPGNVETEHDLLQNHFSFANHPLSHSGLSLSLSTQSLSWPPGSSTTVHEEPRHSQQPLDQSQYSSNPDFSSPSPTLLRKTGTTIAGMVGKDYCILAADTRATMGMTVADNRAEKLHPLTDHIWAAGAGTSADLQHTSRACRYTHVMLRQREHETLGNGPRHILFPSNHETSLTLSETRKSSSPYPSMAAVCHWLRENLYQQQGTCQANLLVGGCCPKVGRPFLRAIHPHGSMDHVAFAALGSGGLAAMAVLEQSFLETDPTDMSLEEAIQVLVRAIRAGIENDLGSGSQIDLVILRPQGAEYRRAAVPEPELPALPASSASSLATTRNGGGVNGFGNAPVVLRPVSTKDLARMPPPTTVLEEEWNQLLGLLVL